jgi:hypothetical protein
MNKDFKYRLDLSSKKHICPRCEKKKFVQYIDKETGNYLPAIYGRCDREEGCQYFLDPYKAGYLNNESPYLGNWQPEAATIKEAKPVFIPAEVLRSTQNDYLENQFLKNLLAISEANELAKIVGLYQLGTIAEGYRKGAVSFPFIDLKGKVRAIQVKQFDQSNHTKSTDFLPSMIAREHQRFNKPLPAWLDQYQKQESKVSCLFGEHLLSKYPSNPVALVEAPKTAIYGTLYFGRPEQKKSNFVWLAVYNLSSLNLKKCSVLSGRKVVLFPDLSKEGQAFKLWSERAATIQAKLPSARFIVSDLLERIATKEERAKGFDLADYLSGQNWHKFGHIESFSKSA